MTRIVECETKQQVHESLRDLRDGDEVVIRGSLVSGFDETYHGAVPAGVMATIRVHGPLTALQLDGPGQAVCEIYGTSSVTAESGHHRIVSGADTKVTIHVCDGAHMDIEPETDARGVTFVSPGGSADTLDTGVRHRRSTFTE